MKKRLQPGEIECSFCGEAVLEDAFARRLHQCGPLLQIRQVIAWTVQDVLLSTLPPMLTGTGTANYESPEHRALREKRAAAAKFIAQLSGQQTSWLQILRYPADFEVSYRHAAIRCHPDRADLGGNTELFQQLQEHKRVLEELHGIH